MYAFVVSHIVCKPMELNSAIDTHTDVNKLYTFLYDVIPRVPETEKGFVARPIVYDSSSVNLVRRV